MSQFHTAVQHRAPEAVAWSTLEPTRIAATGLALHFAFLGGLVNLIRLTAFTLAGHPTPTEPILSSAATYFLISVLLFLIVPLRPAWTRLLGSSGLFHVLAAMMIVAVAGTVNIVMWFGNRAWAGPLDQWVFIRVAFAFPILCSLYCFVVVACRLSDIIVVRDRSSRRLSLLRLRSRLDLHRVRQAIVVQHEIDRALASVVADSGDEHRSHRLVVNLAAFLRVASRMMKDHHTVVHEELELLSRWLHLRWPNVEATVSISDEARHATIDSLALFSTAVEFLTPLQNRSIHSISLQVGERTSSGVPLSWAATIDRGLATKQRSFLVERTVTEMDMGARSDRPGSSTTRQLVHLPRVYVVMAILGIGALVSLLRLAAAFLFPYSIPAHLWQWNVISWCLWSVFSLVVLHVAARLARHSMSFVPDVLLMTILSVAGAIGLNYLTGAVVNLAFWSGGSWTSYLRDILACVAMSDMAMHIFFGLSTSFVVYTLITRRASLLNGIKYERAERSARKTRADILQYQLHSHFLYNSLGMIDALLTEDSSAAAALAAKLRDYYRTCHAAASVGVIPFASEVSLIDEYMRIHASDSPAHALVLWDIDDETKSALTLPMILQPLVENAVRHVRSSGDHTITIRGRRVGAVVRIIIKNAVSDSFQPRRAGVGLWNVQERLRLAYGEDAGALTICPERCIVAVELSFPFRRAKVQELSTDEKPRHFPSLCTLPPEEPA